MYNDFNNMLISIHIFLQPIKNILLIGGLLYLFSLTIYYISISKNIAHRKNKFWQIATHLVIVTFMLPYSLLLYIQEFGFLQHLYVYVPLCTLPLPAFSLLYLIAELYFAEIKKNRS